MRISIAMMVATVMLALCLQPVYSVPVSTSQDTAAATLDIERYVTFDITKTDLFMQVTSPIIIAGERQVGDNSIVKVDTNYQCAIKCPAKLDLTATPPNGTTYTVKAKVYLALGPFANPYQDTDELGDDYWYLDLEPGQYSKTGGAPDKVVTLVVSIEKDWTFADPAGTYSGTLTLTLGPRPIL